MVLDIEDKQLIRRRQFAWVAIALGLVGLTVLVVNLGFSLLLSETQRAGGTIQSTSFAQRFERLRESVLGSSPRVAARSSTGQVSGYGGIDEAAKQAQKNRPDAIEAPKIEAGAVPPSSTAMSQKAVIAPFSEIETPRALEKAINDILTSKSFDFRPRSAVLTYEGKNQLDAIIKMLAAKPDWKFEVVAHVPPGESPDADRSISTKRAESVVNYMATEGISTIRMSSKGMGSTNPIADNNSELGRIKNERIEIRMQGS